LGVQAEEIFRDQIRVLRGCEDNRRVALDVSIQKTGSSRGSRLIEHSKLESTVNYLGIEVDDAYNGNCETAGDRRVRRYSGQTAD
jgi:hypothetical protein